MRASRQALAGLISGLAIAACMSAGAPGVPKERHRGMQDDIENLWIQIRSWRHEAHMDLDPPATMLQYVRNMTAHQAAETCPDSHVPPASCNDICDLADDICENAESICGIANELPGDDWARGKCNSAKASCKEAKQQCCKCDDDKAKAAWSGTLELQ